MTQEIEQRGIERFGFFDDESMTCSWEKKVFGLLAFP
jgi:hypothetical protein